MPRKTDVTIRATKNRAVRKEALREELRSKEYLRQVERILSSKDWNDNHAPYKAKCDVYLALLKKTLPDLKAVEMDIRTYDNVTDSDIDARIDQILTPGREDRASETAGTEGDKEKTALH